VSLVRALARKGEDAIALDLFRWEPGRAPTVALGGGGNADTSGFDIACVTAATSAVAS